MLHIINKSPHEKNSLEVCLRLAVRGSSILFTEDGVYTAKANAIVEQSLKKAVKKHSIYVLGPDLMARGIGESEVIDGITVVDYKGFVRLTVENNKIQSWL